MRLPRWRHWTLRSRLVLAVAALAAVALVVANAAGVIVLRRYLTDSIDQQLKAPRAPAAARDERPDTRPPAAARYFPPGPFDQYKTLIRYDADGTLEPTYTTDMSPPVLEPFNELVKRAGGKPYTVSAEDGESSWRVKVISRDDGGITVAAISLQQVEATVDLLLTIELGVMVAVLLLLGLVSAYVVRIGLRPLTRIERTSAQITAGDLSRRVDADPHTEAGRLGIALNSMLDRIQTEVAARTASEQRLRQFVADASHELRTPLTSIRGFAELYRRGGTPAGPVLDETMSRIESEAARMGLLVEDLLLLAKLDKQRQPQRRPVDLLAIAADTIRDAHARRPDRPVRLAALGADDGAFEPVTVLGDEHRLRQVATNLVSNALQHTPSQAAITVRVGRLARLRPWHSPAAAIGAELPPATPVAVLEVVDTGPGVPSTHAERIFERLYRADPSRNRRNGGSGLGLSIVAAIVSGHGGRVELDTAPGRGSAFRVLLPTGSQSALS
ncbi:HAMP domain-containing histidine kinase [Micromonospora sp. CPCC 205371]|nr:HAMP domain-containing histidine kinase [Micromonospora sp. CPCC 205371]